jgi:Acyltransferase family
MKATSRFPNRPDIDGLRAIAVLSVFLYHLEVPPFGGGFVGVDIFFVISGYLISRIVLTDAEGGRFSMALFFERRIRRLAPAGIVTIIGTLLIGALWFSPEHFKDLAQDVVATVGSVSNFYFWRGSHDYFEGHRSEPVLHFWSLAGCAAAPPRQVRILFPEKYLCDVDCPIEVNGLWSYWDVNYLTVAGARRVGAGAWNLIRGFIADGNLAREQRQ